METKEGRTRWAKNADDVVLNIDVFSPVMKFRILDEMQCTLIVNE